MTEIDVWALKHKVLLLVLISPLNSPQIYCGHSAQSILLHVLSIEAFNSLSCSVCPARVKLRPPSACSRQQVQLLCGLGGGHSQHVHTSLEEWECLPFTLTTAQTTSPTNKQNTRPGPQVQQDVQVFSSRGPETTSLFVCSFVFTCVCVCT